MTFKHYFLCSCGHQLSVLTRNTVVCPVCFTAHEHESPWLRIAYSRWDGEATMRVNGGAPSKISPMAYIVTDLRDL